MMLRLLLVLVVLKETRPKCLYLCAIQETKLYNHSLDFLQTRSNARTHTHILLLTHIEQLHKPQQRKSLHR